MANDRKKTVQRKRKIQMGEYKQKHIRLYP